MSARHTQRTRGATAGPWPHSPANTAAAAWNVIRQANSAQVLPADHGCSGLQTCPNQHCLPATVLYVNRCSDSTSHLWLHGSCHDFHKLAHRSGVRLRGGFGKAHVATTAMWSQSRACAQRTGGTLLRRAYQLTVYPAGRSCALISSVTLELKMNSPYPMAPACTAPLHDSHRDSLAVAINPGA